MIKVIEPANIKLKDISFELNSKEQADQNVQSYNYVPLIYICKFSDTTTKTIDSQNTLDPRQDIVYVKLYNNKFLPEIEIKCNDTVGTLISDLYPFDHDVIISIFVKSNSEITMPIRMDFRVTEFETVKENPNSFVLKYLIRGLLDVDMLYYTRYESKRATSYNLIRDIALSMNLGFASNVEGSNDEMLWINPSETYLDFIMDTTKRAFIDKKSFIWSFIDFYYNITYVNVETELNDQESKLLSTFTAPGIIKDDEEKTVDLYLTNNPAFNMTNKYIDRFNLVNQSFRVNIDTAYRMKSTWYEKNENKTYREFLEDLESGENVIPLNDYNNAIFQENINDDYYIGKVESDNVHQNYAISKAVNIYNLDKIEKMKMVVTLKQINFDIRRFENIKIEIYNINDMFSQKAGVDKPVDNINEHLSGYWLVTGINYLYRRVDGVQQEITLVRRDLNNTYTDREDFRKILDSKETGNSEKPASESNVNNKNQKNDAEKQTLNEQIKTINDKITQNLRIMKNWPDKIKKADYVQKNNELTNKKNELIKKLNNL